MANQPFFSLAFALLVLTNFHQTNAKVSQQNFSLASQFLGPQNTARSSIGLPPLQWDPQLAQYAEWYGLQRQHDCALIHSNGPYGENLFWGSGSGWTPAQAVGFWVSERRWYHYGSNTCTYGDGCGHYTQIVWSSSRRVGCAMIECSGGKGELVVCEYDPPGNYVGEKPY